MRLAICLIKEYITETTLYYVISSAAEKSRRVVRAALVEVGINTCNGRLFILFCDELVLSGLLVLIHTY